MQKDSLGPSVACIDSHGYFTTWSNIVVAITLTALYLNPERTGRIFNRLRNTGLLMITMTMVLYHLLLAGSANPQSWYALTNLLQHYITPVLTILVWAIAGPRGRFPLSDTFAVFIIPIAYLAYTLLHGAIASVYPYGFFNVIKYGYASVLMLMARRHRWRVRRGAPLSGRRAPASATGERIGVGEPGGVRTRDQGFKRPLLYL